MSDRLAELRRGVEQPPSGFDWDATDWREHGSRLLDVVVSASTGWDGRRPSPDDPDIVPELFTDRLPGSPVPFEELIRRL